MLEAAFDPDLSEVHEDARRALAVPALDWGFPRVQGCEGKGGRSVGLDEGTRQ